ncbi:sensor histidine kinase [Flaviaesturariibacter aridisoli]|uniref:histidine kinase n=1 Tax=Flaviaesturariibacter aridisoli TaxID=2545761 RepID=A0A4R4DY17_9BACT|nr:HAMP domain-containing sensor histidine kinase [Flaviaesturariibacter aridisoli]TCZ68339.1 HAMP domain-containing histidine kinase [Flaviaesturariibacter aridisoli]
MFRSLLNLRALLALIAILIVSGTIWYSSYLAAKIEREERQKVEEWVEAGKSLLNPASTDPTLAFKIQQDNDDIPIIWTNERDSIIEVKNLDSTRLNDSNYLQAKLREFRSARPPITYSDPLEPSRINKYYYGNSRLLGEVRYYPYVQLVIVGFFIGLTVLSLRSSYLSTQNQVWAGMAKETAHQLGTPVSSLEGWIELLKETHGEEEFVQELEKDISRLRLVSDRFGKIGSTPKLEPLDVVGQVRQVMEYVKKRAPGRVRFALETHGSETVRVPLSGPLFDWVIENLLKNALDAMEGRGAIVVSIQEGSGNVVIDVADTGKGISKAHLSKVFKPGFTTKKRGWGLGLSLSKRIVDQYHRGHLTVKNSEPGKGTTFRIVLKK